MRISQNVLITTLDVQTGITGRARVRNLVVDAGLNRVRDLLGGFGFAPTHIGLGIGTTAVAAADTAMENEKYRGALTRRSRLSKALELQLFVGQNDGNAYDYTELGLLETGPGYATAGDPATLIARAILATPLVKTSAVELTVAWTLTFTAS